MAFANHITFQGKHRKFTIQNSIKDTLQSKAFRVIKYEFSYREIKIDIKIEQNNLLN